VVQKLHHVRRVAHAKEMQFPMRPSALGKYYLTVYYRDISVSRVISAANAAKA